MRHRSYRARAEGGTRAGLGWGAVWATIPLLAACGGASPAAKTHSVAIRGFQYAPGAVTVAVGDTLVWANEDVVPHTATSADKSWDTGSIGAKASGRAVIDRAGTHQYVCAFHPNMKAEVIAQ